MLTGTQIITGFLLATAFQPTFHDLDQYQLVLYIVLVALAGVATLLGLGPVILHRRLFGRSLKARTVRTGSRLLIMNLVVVSLLVVGRHGPRSSMSPSAARPGSSRLGRRRRGGDRLCGSYSRVCSAAKDGDDESVVAASASDGDVDAEASDRP